MSSILVSLFKYKAWANQQLHEALHNFDSKRFSTEFQTMLATLDHVNVVDRIFLAHLSAVTPPFATTQSPVTPVLHQLDQVVRATDEWYVQYVEHISNAELARGIHFKFTDGDKAYMTCEEILLHVITHAAYHRGSVGQLLELSDTASPPDSLTKYLHRLEPERRLMA